MNDDELKKRLQSALRSRQGRDAPAFETLWTGAEHRYRARRSAYRRVAAVAAVAGIAVALMLARPPNGDGITGAYLTEEDLMSSTRWLAPSDALLPQREFDIYGELPVLIETNDLEEGSLL
ncbi:MAG: hypothetical protein ACE5OQ_07465 [Woeseia sp.]